ncbi:MAG: hypothetical protein ACQES7_11370, partial [Pseudomonadota bacterium]
IHDSRFTIHDSRFTIHDSRFTIHDSRFTIHDSRRAAQFLSSGTYTKNPPELTALGDFFMRGNFGVRREENCCSYLCQNAASKEEPDDINALGATAFTTTFA